MPHPSSPAPWPASRNRPARCRAAPKREPTARPRVPPPARPPAAPPDVRAPRRAAATPAPKPGGSRASAIDPSGRQPARHRRAQPVGHDRRTLARQRRIARHQRRPAQPLVQTDRVRHREPARHVAGPGPVKLGHETLPEPVRDRGRVQPRLPVRTRVQHARPGRCEQPLMKIARIPVGTERIEIERQLARRVRPVHQHRDVPLAAGRDHVADRQHQRPWRRHVIEHRQNRAAGDRGREPAHHLVGRTVGKRQHDLDRHRARKCRHVADDVAHRSIRLVEDEDLVAVAEGLRAQHRVASRGRVLDEHGVVGRSAERAGQHRGRLPDQPRQVAMHERARLLFEPLAPRRLRRAHTARAAAV